MFTIFGYSAPLLFGQLLLGLINGAFYALLSLGLAVIFGMLNIINFAHGALFMVGAFVAWMLQNYLGLDYWWALLLAPLSVGILGILLEKTVISRLYRIDHLYGWRGCSATSTAPPGCRTASRRCSPAAPISASCSCRTTAPGWCWWRR